MGNSVLLSPVGKTDITSLYRFVERYPSLVVLSGAGASAGSGIPTYRDHGGRWRRSTPIQHGEFVQFAEKRRRYWARSAVGWPAVARARPNRAHHALARLEQTGIISLLVTQNVDRLHQKAGHQRVIDLHGRLDQVTCLQCGATEARENLQLRLLNSNPVLDEFIFSDDSSDFSGSDRARPDRTRPDLAPDGDAHVEDYLTDNLKEPVCQDCDGVLMPDVVFFGGTVPRARVEEVNRALRRAQGLLVIGSSLMVYSGYRFCRTACDIGLPIAAINLGQTRADHMMLVKLAQDCETALEDLLNQMNINSDARK